MSTRTTSPPHVPHTNKLFSQRSRRTQSSSATSVCCEHRPVRQLAAVRSMSLTLLSRTSFMRCCSSAMSSSPAPPSEGPIRGAADRLGTMSGPRRPHAESATLSSMGISTTTFDL
eukprot:4335935-Prymnesium_polylepis.3